MSQLDKALQVLQRLEKRRVKYDAFPDPIIAVPVTLLYLCLILSVPLTNLSEIIWMGIYPVIVVGCSGLSYGNIFLKSLIIVPVCVLIGIFNPFYQKECIAIIGNISISEGWLTLLSIVLRGIFAVQSVIIMIENCGFYEICRALRRLHFPAFIIDQLQFVYRYIMVIVQEAIVMRNAREARGYGRASYPMKVWRAYIGQLFIRSLDRSERISKAMIARGFSGRIEDYYNFIGEKKRLSTANILYLILWCLGLPILRFINLSSIFF
ncbi:MAG: energy-coupling factor transporter transmembrane protein EcfT [Muribaculaceae bacterium]|nr:energy-coupling factor transporter transmembrane protein EcfT [Muribaculaceae bacterium]